MNTLIAVLSEMSTLVIWSAVAIGTGIGAAGKGAYDLLTATPPECRGPAKAGEEDSPPSQDVTRKTGVVEMPN